uniref:Roadblock/LAMTOR2 domain-containing protein n=1 Tax=Rhizochromulina marina TaxID=1034831 RepID=A0A7S2SQX1_9STRA|mmetsp:Transcript_33280/g.96447  ORF Transcript_33280/g.96447 Transcript_33280/m.96447 type:complete len:122 (+) Transcript_33280:35-400(+)
MASNQTNEVDEVIRELKQNQGFKSYVIIRNDGIVIKYENMDVQKAVQTAHLVLDLCAKSKKYIKELFEPPDNDVESLRLKTLEFEMIVAQYGDYSLVVVQDTEQHEDADAPGEGEEEKKDA